MAIAEWIESAAREPKAPGGDGFTERNAQHVLAGAETPLSDWLTDHAARRGLAERRAQREGRRG